MKCETRRGAGAEIVMWTNVIDVFRNFSQLVLPMTVHDCKNHWERKHPGTVIGTQADPHVPLNSADRRAKL